MACANALLQLGEPLDIGAERLDVGTQHLQPLLHAGLESGGEIGSLIPQRGRLLQVTAHRGAECLLPHGRCNQGRDVAGDLIGILFGGFAMPVVRALAGGHALMQIRGVGRQAALEFRPGRSIQIEAVRFLLNGLHRHVHATVDDGFHPRHQGEQIALEQGEAILVLGRCRV